MPPLTFRREGQDPKYPWCQIEAIDDGRVVIVDMTPALLGGWRYGRVTVQGAADWNAMTRDQIVAFKQASPDHGMQQLTADQAASFLAWLAERGL